MTKTVWNAKYKPSWLKTKCEELGICQCQKHNVRCQTSQVTRNTKTGVKNEKR